MSAEIFGGRGGLGNEVCVEYARWIPYIVHLYMPICDSESGDFRHLPFPGTIGEQPAVTMELLKLIQLNYRISVRESMKRG